MSCSASQLVSAGACVACGLTEKQMWASIVALACGASTGAIPAPSQILQYSAYNPSTQGLVPPNPNAPAIAYSAAGNKPTYVWNTAPHTWDDGGALPPITVFDEDIEWTFAAPARVFGNSLLNPHTGVINIFGQNCLSGDSFTLTAPVAIVLSNYRSLSLWVSPLGIGLGNALSDLLLQWNSGAQVSIKSAAYGFDATNQVYQKIVIPISDFGVAVGAPVSVLTGTALPKTNFSFYADTIILLT